MIMNILFIVGMLLAFAKLFGYLAKRVGVASLVGEIAAGIFLGPVLGWVALTGLADSILTLGVILILFLAGLEVRFEDVQSRIYQASFLAAAGGIGTVLMGVLVGMFFFDSFLIGLAIGTIFVATSNSTLFNILTQSNKMQTRAGKMIVSTTIADDVLGVLALSLFTVFVKTQNVAVFEAFALFLLALGFYFVLLTFGSRVVNKVLQAVSMFKDGHVFLSIPLVITLVLTWLTAMLGLSLAAGAFLAGMTMANSRFTEKIITPKIETLSSLFIPLFYAGVGTVLTIGQFNPILIAAILVAALGGKFLGYVGAGSALGMRKDDNRLLSVSMLPRGNENIVLAQLVLALGVISLGLFTSVIYVILITVLLTPLLMKLAGDSKY